MTYDKASFVAGYILGCQQMQNALGSDKYSDAVIQSAANSAFERYGEYEPEQPETPPIDWLQAMEILNG